MSEKGGRYLATTIANTVAVADIAKRIMRHSPEELEAALAYYDDLIRVATQANAPEEQIASAKRMRWLLAEFLSFCRRIEEFYVGEGAEEEVH